MKVRELIRALESKGWVHVRTRGSHRQFKHPSYSAVVTVPGKLGKDVEIGMARDILKIAGIEDKR
jgi:predicted RNA binding protein YcfA (HicA-like mRNA interferase family)